MEEIEFALITYQTGQTTIASKENLIAMVNGYESLYKDGEYIGFDDLNALLEKFTLDDLIEQYYQKRIKLIGGTIQKMIGIPYDNN